MSIFLVSNFPFSKSGPSNNQNLASIIGNDKQILSLSSRIKSGCASEDNYFNYLQAIKDKGDLPVVTEYSNPFTKRHSQITNDSCYAEIAFTIWNFICLLVNKTSSMPTSSQEDLLKITPIISDLNALVEDLKFISTKLKNHLLFSKDFINFVESYVNFMNEQQVFQIAIFKQIDNSILKSGGALLNQLQCCLKFLGILGNGFDEYFRPDIKALIQYFNAYLYYRAASTQIKELAYGKAISSLRAASRILNEDSSNSKWFHSSSKISLSVQNEIDSLKNKIEPMLKREEGNNRNIYAQVIPDDPPDLPAAYNLRLFNPTVPLLFYCTVEIPGKPQERYKMPPSTKPPKTDQPPKASPHASPHTSQQLQSSQPANQKQNLSKPINQPPQFTQTTNQPPQFTQQGNQPPQFTQTTNQPPQFTQQGNQPPQFTQTTNQPPQFTQITNQNLQFSPSASQNVQFPQQLNHNLQYSQQIYQNPQFNQQHQFIQQTHQQVQPQFTQQPHQVYPNSQQHYPSMPINQFSPFGSSDMFNLSNNTYQPYEQYPPNYQNPNQYSNIPQSLPGSHFAQTMNGNDFIHHKSQSGGIPYYNQPQHGNQLTNCGSYPNFVSNQQQQFNNSPIFSHDQDIDLDQDFDGPPDFVPTAPPPSSEEIEEQKTLSQHPQFSATQNVQNNNFNGGPPVFNIQQPLNKPNSAPIFLSQQQNQDNGPPIFTPPQGSNNGPPVFTNHKPQQGSNNGPPVFTPPQGSNNGPPVFTNQQKPKSSPPAFTPPPQGSNNGPPAFTPPQQGSNNGPPVFTPPPQGSNNGPPVFTPPPPQGSNNESSPVFTPADKPPAPTNASGSDDHLNASGNSPPTFSQANLNGPPTYTPMDQLSDEQLFPQMAKLKDLKQDVAMKIVDLSASEDEEIMNMVNMYAQQLSEAAVSDGEIDKLIQQYKQPGHSGIQSDLIEKAINGAIGFYSSINDQLVKVEQHK